MPSATRRGVPNRLANTGILLPTTFSNSNAGPCARNTRSQISVISRCVDTGAEMRFSSPICSSCAMKSRRSLYFITLSPAPDETTSHSTKPASGQVAGYLPPAGERMMSFRIKTGFAIGPGLEALVHPEILFRHFQYALLYKLVDTSRVGLGIAAGVVVPRRVERHLIALV